MFCERCGASISSGFMACRTCGREPHASDSLACDLLLRGLRRALILLAAIAAASINSTRRLATCKRPGRVLLVSGAICILGGLSAAPGLAADTFLESDEYEEREEAVGVFLAEDDYRFMVEDLERNDTEFDWGWVLTPGFVADAPEPPDTRHKALRWLPRKRGQKLVQQPHQLGFDLRDYRTVYIPPVQNFAGIMKEGLLEEIRASFIEGARMLGLEVAAGRETAELELALASLDQMRQTANIPVYGIRVDPFVLLELRLTDLTTGEKLMLLRNRKHGNSVADAALNFADDLVKFLR